jgi:hypothetical protein
VVRRRVLLSIFCALSTICVAILCAQESDVVKERPMEIRKAGAPEETPTPAKSPSPKKKKKSSPTPTAKPKSHATPTKTPDEESASPTASPHKKKKSTSGSPNESPSPKKKKKKSSPSPSPKKKKSAAKEKETPSPKPSASAPRAIAVPSATASAARDGGSSNSRSTSTFALSPTPIEEAEQLTIEKSGYERPRSFWERLFGGGRTSSSGAGYHYLSASVRAAIDRASADRRNPRWQLIVVHNSGTRQGNARVFDYYHLHVRHMQNGLAYHFVIGNGTSTGNGQVEVGDRWRRQINGGHVHSDYLNNIAIGICLVGDFNRDQPTRAQLDCCEELVRYLRQGCGKFDNSHFPLVRPHREVNPPRWATDCPGDVFPYSWFRRFRD